MEKNFTHQHDYFLYDNCFHHFMNPRGVTDSGNIRWTCVEAYACADGNVSKDVEEKSETGNGFVPVVCTPAGGVQSVRIHLPKSRENMPDEDILNAITKE